MSHTASRSRRPRRRIRARVKALTGHADGTTPASHEQCLSLLEAVEEYPSWHPDVVKSVEVLERDDGGQPTKVQAKLHVERGPSTRNFDLTMAVQIEPPGTVKLSRIPHHGGDGERFDVFWRLSGDRPTGSSSILRPTSTSPGSCRSVTSATRWPPASSTRRRERWRS